MESLPVRRAFASASLVGKPIRRAVSSAERIGLSGIDTPGGDGLHKRPLRGGGIVSDVLDMVGLAPSGTDTPRYSPVCIAMQVIENYNIFILILKSLVGRTVNFASLLLGEGR